MKKINFRLDRMFNSKYFSEGRRYDEEFYTEEMKTFVRRINYIRKLKFIDLRKFDEMMRRLKKHNLFCFMLGIGPCKTNNEIISIYPNIFSALGKFNSGILNTSTIKENEDLDLDNLENYYDMDFSNTTKETHSFPDLFGNGNENGKINKGSFMITNCRGLKNKKLSEEQFEEAIKVARLLEKPYSDYDEYFELEEEIEINLLSRCNHYDCKERNSVKCNSCDHMLCQEHKKSFDIYLLTGQTYDGDIENNHFISCILNCCMCSNKGVLIGNNNKLYCHTNPDCVKLFNENQSEELKLNLNSDNTNVDDDLDIKMFIDYIENVIKKHASNNYLINYYEIGSYVLELIKYINVLFKYIPNDEQKSKFKDLMLEYCIHLFQSFKNYIDILDKIYEGSNNLDELEDIKIQNMEVLWYNRLAFRENFELDIYEAINLKIN